MGQSCFSCEEFELIQNFDRGINGDVVEENKITEGQKVEYLGVGEYKQDLYLVKKIRDI